MNHFQEIIKRLNYDDLLILNELSENESTTVYKAMSKKTLIEKLNITSSKFRKSYERLSTLLFIETINGKREHLLLLSDYGVKAVQMIAEGEE